MPLYIANYTIDDLDDYISSISSRLWGPPKLASDLAD